MDTRQFLSRWLQFRLSTLLMFVFVSALAMGWWSAQRRLSAGIRERDNLLAVLRMARDINAAVFSADLEVPVQGQFALAPPAFGGPPFPVTTDAENVLAWVRSGGDCEIVLWRLQSGELPSGTRWRFPFLEGATTRDSLISNG